MPDLTTLPLDRLIERCPPLADLLAVENRAAWQELLHRALVDRSDAAWDALVTCLWFSVFAWLYARAPNLTPADAERIAREVLLALRQRHIAIKIGGAGPVTTTMLIAFLQQQMDEYLPGNDRKG